MSMGITMRQIKIIAVLALFVFDDEPSGQKVRNGQGNGSTLPSVQ
jgi:hypothetical protein